MSKINNEVAEGNKLIVKFMGLELIEAKDINEHTNVNKYCYFPRYHSSWDWQIPVWSKIAKQVKELLPKLPNPEPKIKNYFSQTRLYENAVFNNEPEEGQKIIVELIKFYNQNNNL